MIHIAHFLDTFDKKYLVEVPKKSNRIISINNKILPHKKNTFTPFPKEVLFS